MLYKSQMISINRPGRNENSQSLKLFKQPNDRQQEKKEKKTHQFSVRSYYWLDQSAKEHTYEERNKTKTWKGGCF